MRGGKHSLISGDGRRQLAGCPGGGDPSLSPSSSPGQPLLFSRSFSKGHFLVFPSTLAFPRLPEGILGLCNPGLVFVPCSARCWAPSHLLMCSPPICPSQGGDFFSQPDVFCDFLSRLEPRNFPSSLLSKDVFPRACPLLAFPCLALGCLLRSSSALLLHWPGH